MIDLLIPFNGIESQTTCLPNLPWYDWRFLSQLKQFHWLVLAILASSVLSSFLNTFEFNLFIFFYKYKNVFLVSSWSINKLVSFNLSQILMIYCSVFGLLFCIFFSISRIMFKSWVLMSCNLWLKCFFISSITFYATPPPIWTYFF
jgi:hypothetical protein